MRKSFKLRKDDHWFGFGVGPRACPAVRKDPSFNGVLSPRYKFLPYSSESH